MRDSYGCTVGCVVLVVLIFVIGLPLYQWYFHYSDSEWVVVYVDDKYVKRYNEQDRFQYDVTYDDGHKEVLQNADAFWNFKFDSADVNANIEKGHWYEMKVQGHRWKLRSIFRNIIEVKLLPDDECLNLEGYQFIVPEGMIADDLWNCTYPAQ